MTIKATGNQGPVTGLVVDTSFELIVEGSNSTSIKAIPYFKQGLEA